MKQAKRCKHCNKVFLETHTCPVAGRAVPHDNDDDFILSAFIGYATDNAALGAVIGGNLAGGIIGASLNGDDNAPLSSSEAADAFDAGGGSFGGRWDRFNV